MYKKDIEANTLGFRLREAREAKNLTISKACEQLYIDEQRLGKYERNKAMPDLDMLKSLCEFYEVTPNYLLGMTDKPESPYLKRIEKELTKLLSYYSIEKQEMILKVLSTLLELLTNLSS